MTYQINPTLIQQPVQDQLILLDPVREKYLQLNPMGIRMMALLCATGSLDQTATAITKEFDVNAETARRDVARIASELLEHHILLQNP